MKEGKELLPLRPYLLRAHYDWLCDNQLTPFLLVNINYPGVDVPFEYAKDGQIVLNIAPHALGNLLLGNDVVSFSASFNGKSRNLSIPLGAIIAVYARENNAGIGFPPEPFYEKQLKDAEARQSIQLVEESNLHVEPDVDIHNQDDKAIKQSDEVSDKPKSTRRKAKVKSEDESLVPEKKKTKKTSHLRVID
ncbi:ClpXP protease specificity-enhancing factor [Thorsellia anophelis]|uniref:Stringent starvation protein B n=1 Tax=Thorsellia anophelis DSM 18579 TaxID=1123402 RepID=A0A1I0DRX6_9GAMM|nr:ClpXP protease specificity-enhancing factor [Thorsellia anophelis]SET34508.1 stringent starvation protein B [Thorsellia anophelis DSM 18579]